MDDDPDYPSGTMQRSNMNNSYFKENETNTEKIQDTVSSEKSNTQQLNIPIRASEQ